MKIRNDSRGISHILIPLIIIVLAAIAGAGWYVYKNHKDNSNPVTSAVNQVADSAAQKACTTLYNDKVLCSFASKYNPNASYKATFTTTDKDGKQTGMVIESDTKSNSSSVITEGNKETGAFISLNGDTYMKDETDNSWTKYPKSANTPTETKPTNDLKVDFTNESAKPQDQRITYKNLGTDACGNTKCYKYQVIDPSQAGTTSYIWFGTKDYQLHQWSFTDKDGSKNVGTFTYADVTIKAPTPVKEVPSAATPSAADVQKAIDQAQQQ